MPLPDLNDATVAAQVEELSRVPNELSNMRYESDSTTVPVMLLVHNGRLDALDLTSTALTVRAEGTGTGAKALVVRAEGTLNNVLEVANTLAGTPKFVINTSEQTIHRESAFFTGPVVQLGSETADVATFAGSGSVLSIKNLSSATVTGNPTDSMNIFATDSKLRYIDSGGNVWRLPNGNPIPELHGLLSWDYDPLLAASDAEFVQGIVYLQKVLFHRSTQPTTLRFTVTNGATGPTNTYVGVYDLSGNRLTQSADISSMIGTTGTKSASMVSPPVMAPGYYYTAFICGATPGQGPRLAIAGVPASLGNANLSAPNLRFASYSSGLTALPSTITMASMVSTANQLWMGTA